MPLFLQVDQDSPVSPPLRLEQEEDFLPWVPPRDLLLLLSTPQQAGSPARLFPHGSTEVRVSGSHRARAKLQDQTWHTALLRTDPTTTSASPPWVELQQGEKHRPTRVSKTIYPLDTDAIMFHVPLTVYKYYCTWCSTLWFLWESGVCQFLPT